ncbi:hypothetical protein R9X47_10940 [Wukongibacter baidiensis]|uniref:hypothetical protein n=1 Tax=Wukongibacter baidiensis TaxID=1723361 RepID=UPI003D7FDC84
MDKILKSIQVQNNKDSNYYTCNITQLNLGHLNNIVEFERFVIGNLIDKNFCLPSSKEDWMRMLGNEGIVLGSFVNKELIGVRSILFPYQEDDNLGRYISLSEADLNRLFHLELTSIHPDYVGNDLQKKMTKLALSMMNISETWKHVMLTIYPYNFSSLKNIFDFSIIVVKLKKIYNGTWRYILYQNLHTPILIDKENSIKVLSNDIEKQIELLDKGYYGFSLSRDKGKQYILYGKEK